VAGSGNQQIAAGSGNDTVIGGSGTDWIAGQGGNDSLVAGSGVDVFAFANADGAGNDTLGNYQHGSDIIQLTGYGISSFSQLKPGISQAGPNTEISPSLASSSATNEVITITDFLSSNLTADDFLFG
jgi:Ca2+-binding RTX toxin-like protein